MGLAIDYVLFPEDMSQQEIINQCKRNVARNGCSSISTVRFYQSHEPLLNKKCAEEFLNPTRGNSAVRCYVYPELDSTKSNTIRDKINETSDKIRQLEKEKPYKNAKSAFVGCKHCGSKVNVNELNNNRFNDGISCPVCHKDIRPETRIKQIEVLKEKQAKLREQLKSEIESLQKKAQKQAEVMWLVCYEYYY